LLKDRVLQVASNPFEVENDLRASIGGATPGTTTRASLSHSPDRRHWSPGMPSQPTQQQGDQSTKAFILAKKVQDIG
jgi:hypothetical protein